MKMVFLYVVISVTIVGISFFGISSFHFNTLIREEIDQLNISIADTTKPPELFNYSVLQRLPAPVRRYLRKAIPDAYPIIHSVQLNHTGYFRTEPNSDWWPIKGKQYYRTDKPAFVWIANVKPFPGLWLKARDKYLNGEGEVLVRLLSAITVAKTANPRVNQSAFIRFIGEIPWFPTAFLPSDYLRWEPINDRSARAIITDSEITASVTFFFNEQDEVIRFFTEDRYRDKSQQDFTGYYRDYREINGVRIPTEVEVQWNTPDSDFSYARFVLQDIVYNQ